MSVRTIARLPLPRIKVGWRTVYLHSDVMAYVERQRALPVTTAVRKLSAALVRDVANKSAARVKTQESDPEARYKRRMGMFKAA